jgi:hypothetical protein
MAFEMTEKGKKGQMTLWIVVAILFVGLMVFVFIALKKQPEMLPQKQEDPVSKIDLCTKNAVYEALDKMLPQGGFIEPKNYKVYSRTNISYLCLNEGSFNPCIMQHPAFLSEIKEELYNHINPKVDECFTQMKEMFESENKKLEIGAQKLNISFAKGKIFVITERKTMLAENEKTQTFEVFKSEINSPLYDLAKVAIEIANQEAKYCSFEYVGYMNLYPKFKITKTLAADSTKIYSIKDISSNKQMNIAIRSCTIPAGI